MGPEWTLHKNQLPQNGSFIEIGFLKTDPKFKNYNVIFHICCATNEFTSKFLKKNHYVIFFR